MAEPSLTDRLRETLAASAARREAEAAADQLSLSRDDTMDMDEAADLENERIVLADEAQVRAAKLAMTRELLLYLRAPVSARTLALTVLTASQTRPIHSGPVGDLDPRECEHMVTDVRVICSSCLSDFGESLPPRALRAIELTARAVPLDETDRWSLAAEQVVDRILDLGATVGLSTAPVSEPPPFVAAVLDAVAETPVDLGSLPSRLAELLRENN